MCPALPGCKVQLLHLKLHESVPSSMIFEQGGQRFLNHDGHSGTIFVFIYRQVQGS
jgi:hypothetical protein